MKKQTLYFAQYRMFRRVDRLRKWLESLPIDERPNALKIRKGHQETTVERVYHRAIFMDGELYAPAVNKIGGPPTNPDFRRSHD